MREGNEEMPRIIAINGTRLDEVRMPLEPDGSGALSYLSYPMSEIRLRMSIA